MVDPVAKTWPDVVLCVVCSEGYPSMTTVVNLSDVTVPKLYIPPLPYKHYENGITLSKDKTAAILLIRYPAIQYIQRLPNKILCIFVASRDRK